MLPRDVKKEIYKLYAIKALRSFMVAMPIIALYFLDSGLSIRDIFLLQIIFAIAVVVVEVPSGYIAVVFGRKNSLVIGSLFASVGLFAYYLGDSFSGFVVAELLLALSAGFISGADSAFLFDTLDGVGESKLYAMYEGRKLSVSTFSEAIASLLGGALALVSALGNLFLVHAIFMLLAVVVSLSLREPKVPRRIKKRMGVIAILTFALRENKRLLYLNMFGAVLSASTLAMVWFSQPYWKEIGVPLLAFGVLWAALNLLVAISSWFAHRLERIFRFRNLFAALAVMPLVLYVAVALAGPHIAVVGIMALFWVLRGINTPIIRDYINREVDASIRATVLSVQSLFSKISFAILSPFVGWIADIYSFTMAFYASGIIFGSISILFGGLLIREMYRVREKSS